MYTNVCEICGEPFETSQPKKKCCDKQHYKKCVTCGKEFPVNKRNWKTKQCCSRSCLEEWYKRTGKSEEMHRKTEETKRKRYYDKGIVFNAPKKTRKCVICGKEFKPEAANQKVCKDKHFKPCCICGNPVEVDVYNYDKDVTCSKDCRYKLVKKTNMERYGVDNAAKSPVFKRKAIETSLKRYGVEYPTQSDAVKKKTRSTCLKRYGVPAYFQCKDMKQKAEQTCLEKYGVRHYLSNDKARKRISQTMLERYGVPWYCMTDEYQDSRHPGRISKINTMFSDMLRSYGCETSFEFSVENRLYDVKCGNVLIELNPTFTHNSEFNCYSPTHKGKDKNYHLNKSKLAESHGYRCIHVWDWDDWNKVVRLVLPITRRIYARKCQVVELSKKEADEFLDENHLQGTCKGQKVRLGLSYQGELVEVITFGTPRYNKKFEWEILRLCSASGTSVIGGPSKLFNYFIKSYSPSSILSYCDRSKFTGDVYRSIGMTLASESGPNKHWCSSKTSERMNHITNNFLLQRGFDQIFGTSFGKGTSNEQLMLDRGYLPVYDCGQMRFEWSATL